MGVSMPFVVEKGNRTYKFNEKTKNCPDTAEMVERIEELLENGIFSSRAIGKRVNLDHRTVEKLIKAYDLD